MSELEKTTAKGRRGLDESVAAGGRGPTGSAGFLLTPGQVAQRLQVSVAWVRDHSTRKRPRLPVVRIGGLLRFDSADIDRWIEAQRAEGHRRAC